MATITKIGILNRAAQLLGQPAITSINDSSKTAKSLFRAYDSIFLAELEANTWGFSIRRAQLAAAPTPPAFGGKTYFPLPGDFLFMAPPEATLGNPLPNDFDFETFNNTYCVLSSRGAPLPIRYVSSNIVESAFSATFAEAFAYALALATAEEITNSNTKSQVLERGYMLSVQRAKKRNDIQQAPRKSPTCTWISVRD